MNWWELTLSLLALSVFLFLFTLLVTGTGNQGRQRKRGLLVLPERDKVMLALVIASYGLPILVLFIYKLAKYFQKKVDPRTSDAMGAGFVLKKSKDSEQEKQDLIPFFILFGGILWIVVYLVFLRPIINQSIFNSGVSYFPAAIHLLLMIVIPSAPLIIISSMKKASNGKSSVVCPSCKEKNNPAFSKCWKCHAQL